MTDNMESRDRLEGLIPVEDLEEIPRLMAARFAAHGSRWKKGDPLAEEFEEWRGLFECVEAIRRADSAGDLLALADYVRDEGMLEKNHRAEFLRAGGLAVQRTACRAMAEALYLCAGTEDDLVLGDRLLELSRVTGWERSYFLCLRELGDRGGDILEVAQEAADNALVGADEVESDRETLVALRALAKTVGRHAPLAPGFALKPGQVRDLDELPDPLTAEDMAPILRVSVLTVRRLQTDGTMPSRRQGRLRFTRKKDFKAYLEPERTGRR